MKALTRITLLIISIITMFNSLINAQDHSTITNFCDSLFRAGLSEKMIPGGAVSIVRNGKIILSQGYGYADVENQTPVRADKTLFQVGSVGKILTAMAVLKLVEEETLDLEKDIRAYLDGLSFVESFPAPVTLRHLLTHTAGINERVIGYAARTSQDVQSLEQYLDRRFPNFFQDPGKSISYSNYGYALAGLIVEKASGVPFTRFIEEHFLYPLQMQESTYSLPGNNENSSGFAKGYGLGREGFLEQPIFYTHTSPAGGLNSTASDMSNLMKMLLNRGKYRENTILKNESIELLLNRQFSNHSGLSGYTFGFEEQNINGNFAVAKGGSTMGYTSLMLLIPDQQIGVFVTTNVRSDDFIELFAGKFCKDFIESKPEKSPFAKIERSEDIYRFEGVYRSNRYNHNKSIENLFSLFRANLTVKTSSDGFLTFYSSGKKQEYEQVSKLVFQNRNNFHDLLKFEENENGKIVEMYRNTRFAGMSVPVSYEKVSWFSSPTFINEFYLSFVPMYLVSYIFYPLLWIILLVVFHFRRNVNRNKSFPRIAHIPAFLFGSLSIIYVFGYIARLMHLGSSIAFGVPEELINLNYIPYVLVLLLFPLIYYTFNMWLKKSGILLGRVYYTSYLLSAIIFVNFLYTWNFIGFHY